MYGKGFPWHHCKQGSLLRKKAKPASTYLNKEGWNQKENTAGYSRQDSLRALWSLYLGKIGVEEARYNEGGAKKADAQQRDSKWERNVLRAVRFCCRPCQTRTVEQGRQGCPLGTPFFLALPPFRYDGLQETLILGPISAVCFGVNLLNVCSLPL